MELSKEDRNKLLNALDQISEVLGVVVKEDLQKAINSSYKNNNINLIPMFKDSFPYAGEEIFRARREISDASSDLVMKLDEHNLVGKPLELKVEIIRIEHDNYLKERKHRQPSYLKRIIGKCLGGFDILLESLADCKPGLGAVTEFKKALEHVTKKE